MTQADTPTTGQPTTSRRRWLQFSLRTLLLLTMAVAAWLGWWSHNARQQREAVAALRSAGALVTYDSEQSWTNGQLNSPSRTQWLQDLLGVDYFGSVEEVWFPAETVRIDLEMLKRLPVRTRVNLRNAEFPDLVLAQLKDLTTLQELDLTAAKLTDTGLKHIASLTHLRDLCLLGTQVTDAGLAHLKELTSLQELYLGSTPISDDGLRHLQNLQNLQVLELMDTRVTDASVEHIGRFSNLELLYLNRTSISAAGVARLQQSLPNCEINH